MSLDRLGRRWFCCQHYKRWLQSKFDYEVSAGAGTSTITIDGKLWGNTAKSESGYRRCRLHHRRLPSTTRSTCNVVVNGSARGLSQRDATTAAAAFYLGGGQLHDDGRHHRRAPTSGTSNGNKASADGGGFYITDGTCTVSGGTISLQRSHPRRRRLLRGTGSGPTTYINSSTATTNINDNKKAVDGDVAYVASGSGVNDVDHQHPPQRGQRRWRRHLW